MCDTKFKNGFDIERKQNDAAKSEYKYLTRQELCKKSGLSPATITRYQRSGRIPFFQPGGKRCRILYPDNALEAAQAVTGKCSPANILQLSNSNGVAAPSSHLRGPRPKWQTKHP